MLAALPYVEFFGMDGTPVRTLATDTFTLFGEETDPGRVLRQYSVCWSLLDETTVPVMLDLHPVVFEMDDQALQAEFDQFADDLPRRPRPCPASSGVSPRCSPIRIASTRSASILLGGFKTSQVLAGVGKHDQIAAEVNTPVSDSKDEHPAMRPFQLSEAEAVGHGGVERLGGGPGQAAGRVVDEGHGILTEQGVGPARELEVMGDVSGGLFPGHGGHGAAEPDPLVQGGEPPSRSIRRRVGWPRSRQASRLAAFMSAFVRILTTSSWA